MSSEELAPALEKLAERYEIVREVGRGGMASVFLARELATGRMVAIKTIDARHADDAEARARFAREAHTVAALEHPNVVRTLAVEEVADGVAAIVMEYVPGGTLRELLRSGGPLDYERAERILHDVAEALRYAHGRGLIHRDVKPENVFLDENGGRALLSDFGIARAVEDANRLTLTGTSIGTPTYMSPEQIDGKKLDARTDIYSLGLVGWEMLAGARPWEGESLYKVIYKQKHEELPRLTVLRPDIPEHLLFAIEGALHKDRETRWANLNEFLDELSQRPRSTVHAGAVAATPEAPAVAAPPPQPGAPFAETPRTSFERPQDIDLVAEEPAWATASAVGEGALPHGDPGFEPRRDPPTGAATEEPAHHSVPEDPWSVVYVPGTPEEEARRDAEALGRWPRRPWSSWLERSPWRATAHADAAHADAPSGGSPDAGAPYDDGSYAEASYADAPSYGIASRRQSRLLVPLALAAVAVLAIGGGLRSRSASPRVAVDVDSVTRATSAGELETAPARVAPATDTTSSAATRAPARAEAPPPERAAAPTPPRAAVAPRARSTRPPVATTPRARIATRVPRSHGDSLALCSTPGIVEQQACLGAALADRDRGLNNVYQTLIKEMRRQEGVRAGAPDPPSVQALRAQQRQWLVTRDETCRREASAASAPLWAGSRVRCLGREGVVRSGVLADRLTRLRAP